mmetsp:Transcript_49980/g.119287  ORF Transcript_49980/g.119287 Transcript_49980/m.119287 type:complete len:398 (-) Transcript_49980:150-1343(-)|eukprot:CAMPEP_0181412138 /NCGR_PEP_ID=MMETSP1110-20121109/8263_1 /TAXON_ID=174948 /ORGANISM="Symbiodinium sp., Strain CCMP421" /LENGTH=397 /DNA_ID=CAMNT_0023534833 /DNA_START=32 /DNA_END=1225 /DNA_ORIENTATION=+
MGTTTSSEPVLEDGHLGDFGKRYTLGKQIGKGSQGVVHLCHDRESGACKAVKMLDRRNKTAWATYKREVELSQATTGKNIASVMEEFVDAERCYVIMEKFEGHLRKALKWVAKENGDEAAGLDAYSLSNVVRQVLSAILHLHTCGVVHRDVKAHNLLIDRYDLRDSKCRIVLSDFGLARRLEPGRFLCAQVGTRKYWAPELYEKKYWHVVDVFAVGVLMFLAASNMYPYQDEDQTRTRDVFDQDLVPPEVPQEAVSFMQLCLTKDPNFRPSAAELGQHPWLQSNGGIIQQVDDEAIKSLVGRGPCTVAGSRRFGPKVTQLPTFVRGLRGDQADGVEVGCMEPGKFRKDLFDDSDPGSTTMHAQHSPCSDTTPYSKDRSVSGFTSFTRSFLVTKAQKT